MSDKNDKAIVALEYLKEFYMSDISNELKESAKKVLLDYFKSSKREKK